MPGGSHLTMPACGAVSCEKTAPGLQKTSFVHCQTLLKHEQENNADIFSTKIILCIRKNLLALILLQKKTI